MHPQLERLLEIQDLKNQRSELSGTPDEREVEEGVFGIQVEEALEVLNAKITEMEEALDPRTRGRYQRLAGNRPRVVVPVIRGTCYGCFVSVPTAHASDVGRNEELSYCESCGRFLYYVD
jgi:predicted  nucleic acid-binding Zn-ribbon protein